MKNLFGETAPRAGAARLSRGRPGPATAIAALLILLGTAAPAAAENMFNRIATFPVFENTDVDEETAAEIVTATEDGNTLIYTDSPGENIGFIDITDPGNPVAAGIIALPGEPTSVAVAGYYALAAVVTDDDYADPDGELLVFHIPTRTLVRTIDLNGQPDSVAVSPDGRYAAIVLENERNEDFCVGGAYGGREIGDGETDATEDECEDGGGVVGGLPQLPSGELVILNMFGGPALWKTETVPLAGYADIAPTDAEAEYVDINENLIAAVTLQENNYILLVDVPTATVVGGFSAGTVDLTEIDTDEEGLITLVSSLDDVPREPDAVAWISRTQLATADEGDLDGGSRGFTIFNTDGSVAFSSGNALEHLAVSLGHYPEGRSGNKGNEPEGAEYGVFGGKRFLFIGSERSSLVFVYALDLNGMPTHVQTLPAGFGPEGLLAIPERNLFVVSCEEDSRDDGFRGSVVIYEYQFNATPAYPTIVSDNRADGTPIPWAALSGLASHPFRPDTMYSVYDSFFAASRIFTIDVGDFPARITDDLVLRDENGDTVDLDLEGVYARPAGFGFWVVSEGAGSVDDPNRPVESADLLIEVSPTGKIVQTVELPEATNALQRRFGFEGVTATGIGDEELVYVAFQREWVGDPDNHVRIGRYEVASGVWTFFYYPIEDPTSPLGGWVGLSEITAIDEDTFVVVERDNRAGPDARIKRIYEFSIDSLEPQPEGGEFPVVTKTLVRDLMPDLEATNGLVIEKVEGLSLQADGDVFIATDNDGVDDNSGETQVINLGNIF